MTAAEKAPRPGTPGVGDIFEGKCRIERVLGVGGMGIVLAATHLHLQRRVAVKLLLPEVANNTEVIARFLQEGRAAARMRSEHVAHVYDVATTRDHGEPYMIMEYLEGQDLDRVLETRGSLGVEEAIDYLLEACEAVAEAHARGIIHRDLKPSNLFLAQREDGSTTVKVLDFGISKLLNDSNGDTPEMNITKTRSILGSPSYMSPEQLRASKHVDARADIWALGVILYELLAGTPPFDGQTVAELGAQILAGEVPPLRARVAVPAELEQAILLCLRKDREERCQTVAVLADAIARFGTARALASAARIIGASGPPSSQREITPAVASARDLGQAATVLATTQDRKKNARVAAALGLFLVLGAIGAIAWRASLRARGPAPVIAATTTTATVEPAPPLPASIEPVASAVPVATSLVTTVPASAAVDPPRPALPRSPVGAVAPARTVHASVPPKATAVSPPPSPPVPSAKATSDRFQ